jgi:hypothetical protein
MGLRRPPGIGRAAPDALSNTVQPEHIRKLYRTYLKDCQSSVPPRHRGKSPQQAAFFTRSARARHESALLATLCRLIGALPAPAAGATTTAMTSGTPSESARSLAGLNRGELLCQAYESYRTLFPSPLISFEHAVFLLGALWRGNELVLGSCRDCNAVLVADRWSLRAPRCVVCAPPGRPAGVVAVTGRCHVFAPSRERWSCDQPFPANWGGIARDRFGAIRRFRARGSSGGRRARPRDRRRPRWPHGASRRRRATCARRSRRSSR